MRWSTLILAATLSFSASAEARSVRDEPYPFATAWNTAIRLIRVDLGCPIVERDMEIGYFTFTYRDGNRTVPGSVEMVRTTLDGRDGVRVILQIPQEPTYVETVVLNQLGRKLRTEFGEPVAPVRRAPPPPPPGPGERPDGHPTVPVTPGVNLPIVDPNAPSNTPPTQNPPQNPPNTPRSPN